MCGVKTTKKRCKVCWQRHSKLYFMFVQPFYFAIYYFLELNLTISFFIFRRHTTTNWGRDMGMILRLTRISIWICGWRQDRLVDHIEIECTNSPTLQLRTWRRPVMSQPLGAWNRYRAPSLRSLQPRDTTKRLMSSPKCRSVEVINNPARPGSNHREVNCINYK